ncbi:hypothetical protein [Cupriavidus sp. TMH.W2]
MKRTVIELKELRKEFPKHVVRILLCLEEAGFKTTANEATFFLGGVLG